MTMVFVHRTTARLTGVVLALLLCALPAKTASAQSASEERLRQQRNELDSIRRERDGLQQRLRVLQGKAHDLDEETRNLHRQAEATARLVASLDKQLVGINAEVDSTNIALTRAQNEINGRRTALKRRVVEVYKRGAMYTTEALLSARTFGELVGRYRYLHELTLRDRSMVNRVQSLYQQIDGQRGLLLRLQGELERNRQDKSTEVRQLRTLEGQKAITLTEVVQSQKQVQDRLTRIQRDEQRLTQLLASLEEARRKAEARPNAPAPTVSTLKTSDFGKLDWPVDGDILYRFGRAINPNNTAIRWNGVGIRTTQGTAVHSVAAGEVMVADPIGTYGLTVIVQHGGGDYSVYGSLSRSDVHKGDKVTKGQVIGAVGRADPDMDPHLHFEIRPKGRAMDPLTWLTQQSTGTKR
ncbi:MAG: peptidoglycan DD-metalloendopeptidase family protein [Gemmatimonadaceae bacterium]